MSFLGQYIFSLRAGTEQILLHHPTVIALDWIFIPFNFFVVRVIDWRRGGRFYFVFCIAVAMTIATHAFWQHNRLDPGHMITSTGVLLAAGWVHLAFSILQMVLLVAFVFCRRPDSGDLRMLTTLATVYFLGLALCGYITHGEFMITDLIVVLSGLFFVLVYPKVVHRRIHA